LPHEQTISISIAPLPIKFSRRLATTLFLLVHLRSAWSFWQQVVVAVLEEEMHQQRLCDAEVEAEVEEATFQRLCQ